MQELKDLFKHKIEKIGERVCEHCGSDVPIYKQQDREISVCLECDNKRVKKRVEKFRKERKYTSIMRLVEKYESPPYEETVSFDDYVPKTETQKQAKETAMNFETLDSTTLFLQGKPGIGKSHLAFCVAENWKEQGKTSLFIDVPTLLQTIRNSYNHGSIYSEEELFRLIDDVDLFVLDEIGAEYVKSDGSESWVTDILIRIFNSRRNKRNIYTTNYQSKMLKQKYGVYSSRLISRMMENAKVIVMDGPDHRLKGMS
mgnify:CR=1 FL=1